MSRPLDTALSIAANALTCDGAVTKATLPQGARLALQRRAALLDASLMPADPERVRMILATLAQMPRRVEDDPAKLRFALEVEVSDLSRWPEWALVAACRAYRNNDLGAGPWRPSTAELATYCRAKVAKLQEERGKIGAVLSAKISPPREIIDPERRRRIANGVRGLVAGMTVGAVDRADVDRVFAPNREAAE